MKQHEKNRQALRESIRDDYSYENISFGEIYLIKSSMELKRKRKNKQNNSS